MADEDARVENGAEAPGADRSPAQALRSLAVMQQLLLEAGGKKTRQELVFHILNRTVDLIRYDRAVLWDITGTKPGLLGVSGAASADRHSALAGRWREALAAFGNLDELRIFSIAYRDDHAASVLWLPVRMEGERFAGLWLERWSPPAWSEGEARILSPLLTGYCNAFRPFMPRGWMATGLRRRRLWLGAAVAACLVAVLAFVKAPLRIVAPCEVTPNKPFLVNAPIDGVIEEMLVRPGQRVAAGEMLFAYAGEAERAERDVAWQQVAMVRSDLARARAQALGDRAARAQMPLLESRVRQEEARLASAEYRLARLRVRAEKQGVVLVGDPAEWRGRPVATGEAVLMLIEPDDSKLRIWLPQDDRIDIDLTQPASVMLNAEPGRTRWAALSFISVHARPGPEGVYGFMAEAHWRDSGGAVAIGQRGIAVVYGERVPLGYWLLRKPLASLRRFLGI